jgi:hypothetical protein
LQPNEVEIDEIRANLLDIGSKQAGIKKVEYTPDFVTKVLDVENFDIHNLDSVRKSLLLGRSPLFRASKNINSLLAVYSARYNVYANNGAAGYIVYKGNQNAIEAAINPLSRDEMLKEINSKNGITGKRNFWGVSSIPMEFVETMGKIKDLMPFEETLENTIKIASIFQIPAGLVHTKYHSTYNNQDADEIKLWENTLISVVENACELWSKFTMLSSVGYKIRPDYSSVSALNKNKESKEDYLSKKLANLEKMKQMNPENSSEIDKIITEIVINYGK